jgi:Domain of unknown function (DUF4164)
MNETFAHACLRFESAVSVLKQCVRQRAETFRSAHQRDLEYALLLEDRARLALDLDASLDRQHRLEHASLEVLERLETVIHTLDRSESNG